MDKTGSVAVTASTPRAPVRVHLTVAAVAVLLIAGVVMAHDLFLYVYQSDPQ